MTQSIVLLDGVTKCHSVEVVGPGVATSMVETYTITTYNTDASGLTVEVTL